jgi:hypothetical protein
MRGDYPFTTLAKRPARLGLTGATAERQQGERKRRQELPDPDEEQDGPRPPVGKERPDNEQPQRPCEQRRRTLRALDDRVRLGDRVLVVADELGKDQLLRREVRGEEAAEAEDEHEQPTGT